MLCSLDFGITVLRGNFRNAISFTERKNYEFITSPGNILCISFRCQVVLYDLPLEYSDLYKSLGAVLLYMGYISMCGSKGYGFSAVLVINRVSILADFGHFGHK